MGIKNLNKGADNAEKNVKAAEAAQAAQESAKVAEQVKAEADVVEAGAGQNVGKMSGTLEFIASLGDPSVPDKTTDPKTNITTVRATVVGYQFKSSVDLEVPDVQPGADFKNNPMSFSGDPLNTRHVKAGEVFSLTLFETGMLISREEYNSRATGGTMPVYCAYANVTKVGTTGGVQTASGAVKVPRISLRALKKTESDPGIKDYPFVDVLTFTSQANGKAVRKARTIVPGFEKWAALCQDAVRTAGAPKAVQTTRNANADAFLKIVQKAAQK